ncbi:MAG TPA: RNA polymerase sigma factor SigJ [Micromonosporaceae bacterium]|nr:RNA polymerase sigma factor SigJ [Micromonosporaceae bacterium]
MTGTETPVPLRRAVGHHNPAAAAAAELTAHRPMLYGLAYRLLGSGHDADDVLQEAFLRWLNTDRATITHPRRYLTRVVTHLAMDRLRERQALRESYVGTWLPEPVPTAGEPGPLGPLDTVEQRESLSIAALHLLERLNPPERAVYVLRTAFNLPYTEIAELLERSPEDCRQLYHRGVRRIDDGRRRFTAGRAQQERLVTSFIAAARDGDIRRLVELLAADVTAWSDGGGKARAARNPIRGAEKVARFFVGIHRAYGRGPRFLPTELNGQPAYLIDHNVRRYAILIAADAGLISDVYVIANPDKLRLLGGLAGVEISS